MKTRQRGFTLLEAIVAMVLVAVVGTALFAWLNVSVIGIERAISVKGQADALQSAKAIIADINPMQKPHGELIIEPYIVNWRSRPVTAIKPNRNGGNIGFYDVALYQVDIEIASNGKLVDEYQTHLVGYSKEREYELLK